MESVRSMPEKLGTSFPAVRIAIIGGGPTAVALIENLIHARSTTGTDVRLDLTVFDPSPHPWCGRAFAPDRTEALSNSFTVDMSVRHWQPEHVEAWLKANGHEEFTGYKFAPRPLIGRYFKESIEQAISTIEEFAFIREPVTRLTVVGDSVHTYTDERRDVFDYAVIAVGCSTVCDPYGLEGHKNFHWPYPMENAMAKVDPDEHIGIVGSGLTAVDLVMALKADKHRGRITILSRHGLLPAAAPLAFNPYELQYFTIEGIEEMARSGGKVSLKQLVRLFNTELDNAGASSRFLVDDLFSTRYGIDRLRRQLLVEDGGAAYSLVLKMYTAFQDAWYFLDPADKRLVADFEHIFYSICCPFLRHRAIEALELADTGQLDVVRGLRSVAADSCDRFVAITEDDPPRYLDRVFSAVSHRNILDPLAVPLVDGLLQSGDGSAHPFGGLEVERTTSRLLDRHNRPQPRVYAVGAVTSGAFHILNSFALLRHRAAHIADAIFGHYREERAAAMQPVSPCFDTAIADPAANDADAAYLRRRGAMGPIRTEIIQEMHDFIEAQKLFFVATAPREGRVNLSPKGLDTLRILDSRTVAYLDLTGSGNETAAHVSENGRMTMMFCAFTGEPLILRLYGKADLIRPDDPDWELLRTKFPALPGARQIFRLHIDRVGTSCGTGVPLIGEFTDRSELIDWSNEMGEDKLEAYRLAHNVASIDGLPTGYLSDDF